MADWGLRVEAEIEAIEKTLSTLPRSLADLTVLELAGTAACIHNFYNGVENILKQIFQAKKFPMPEGATWHRDLLLRAVSEKVIRESTADQLREYLAFRHFFSHGYTLDLNPDRLEPLLAHIQETYQAFRDDISRLRPYTP